MKSLFPSAAFAKSSQTYTQAQVLDGIDVAIANLLLGEFAVYMHPYLPIWNGLYSAGFKEANASLVDPLGTLISCSMKYLIIA